MIMISRCRLQNAARLPDYHRLDVNANYMFVLLGVKEILGVNIINVYDQKNVFYFDRKTSQCGYVGILPDCDAYD